MNVLIIALVCGLAATVTAAPRVAAGVDVEQLSATELARGTDYALRHEGRSIADTPLLSANRVKIIPGRSYQGRLVKISPKELIVRDAKTKEQHAIERGEQAIDDWRVGDDVTVRLDDNNKVVGVDRLQ